MDSIQQIKMEKVVVLFCLFAATSAVFFPFLNLPKTGQNMMNVCVYSMDPSRYQPKCFLCPSTVYSNVLQACLNAAAIPRNITYTQALCLEQNCAINRGKRSVDVHQPKNLLEEFDGQLPIDDDEENAEDQQNGKQDGDEQKNLPDEFDAQLPIDDEEEIAEDLQQGKQDGDEQKNLLEEFDAPLPIDDEQENAEDRHNGKHDGDEQKNLIDEFDAQLPTDDEEEIAGDQQNVGQDFVDLKNGSQAAQHDGYKIVGTEEFMASDVEDYLDYSDVVD